MKQIFGVDYGSKLAGTTVVACYSEGCVSFYQSSKNESADDFLIAYFAQNANRNDLIALDAPLSLPLVYSEPNPIQCANADFHFRICDREVNAMSPLFLGGLTARAMSLAAKMNQSGLKTFEVYPKMVAREEGLKVMYEKRKKEPALKKEVALFLAKKYHLQLIDTPSNLHALDALLALIGGIKISKGSAATWGNLNEGLIYG